MPTRRRLLFSFLLSLVCFAFVFGHETAWAQAIQVTLASSTAPAAGQAGVTVNNVTGSSFPSGTIPVANVTVTLTPAQGGTAVSTTATSVVSVFGSTRRVAFMIPASISVTSPAQYLVSISGMTSGGISFVSCTTSAITINPPAQIVLSPNSGAAGTTATVNIAGTFSSFVQGMTQANFGPNTSVGGGSSGGFGVVTVNSPTSAAALVQIDSLGLGTRTITVQTGRQLATATFTVTAGTQPPIANAGPNQTVAVGATVQLDGTGSSDPGGHVLTYLWSFTQRPSGSGASLSDPTNPMPTFVADKFGDYKLQLVVNNGTQDSAPAFVTISTQATAPTAKIAPLGTTPHVGDTLTFDGSQSFDTDGFPITYAWTIVGPSGSQVALDNASAVMPKATLDKFGSYTVQLTVTDSRGLASTPAILNFNTQSLAPLASCGQSQSVHVNQIVFLDGSGSVSRNNLPLTYAWSFNSKPANSNATLSDPTAQKPSFIPDQPGLYVVQLIVTDNPNGTPNPSAACTVNVSTNVLKPVANAGNAQTVTLGATVNLDGSGSSDPQGLALTYKWTVASVPTGSNITTGSISNANTALPSFKPDVITGAQLYVLTLVVNNGFLDSDPSNVAITVNAAAAASLSVTGFPNPTTAGVLGSFTVTARDSGGNVASSYTGTIHFTSSDPAAVLPTDYTFTAADQGIHTFSGTLKTAGTQSVSATDTSNSAISGSQTGIVVNEASATTLSLTGFPNPVTAGVAGSFTVTLHDAFNNLATGYRGTVHFTSSDAQAALPADYTFTAADAGTHLFSATLKTVGTQSITGTDTANASITGSQTGIVVNAAAGTTLVVSGFVSSTTAGAQGSFSVTLRDSLNNIATGYRGTVHFTSSDAQASLPADYTFTAADAGVHIFTATLKTVGTQSITGTDTTNASITGTQSGIVVHEATATRLIVANFPSPIASGTVGSFTVTAQDSFSNIVTSYRGTVHFTSSDAQAVLPGDFTFTAADAGVHSFSATLKTAGTQSITATDTPNSIITGTQSNIVVNPAPATVLVVAGFPNPTTAGVPGNFTVTIRDAQSNVVTGYRGTVHFASSDSQASLPADYTFTAADAGVHTFSATLKTAGTQSISGTDTATTSITGSQTGIVVNAAAATILVLSGFPNPATAGTAGSFSVTLRDALNNIATGYRGTVHFTSSDAQAVLPADYTFTAADAGTHTFSGTLKTVGTQSLTGTDTANVTIFGSQTGILVVAGTANKLVFTVQPTSTASGASVTPAVQVTIEDTVGNTVTTANNAITVSIGTNPSNGTLSGTVTANAVNGVVTFSNLSIDKAGTGYALAASATGLTGATSNAFNIIAGTANKLGFIVQPTNTASGANITPAVQVAVQDAGGNTITTATNSITIAISINPGSGTLGGTLTVAAINGVATFNNLSIDKAGTGYILAGSATGLTSATTNAFNITASSPNKLGFVVQPTNTASGASITPAVQVAVQDAGGNTITTATNSITVSVGTNPSSGTLSGTLTITAVNGVATFNNLSIDKAGSGYTVAAAASGLTSATSTPFNITSGTATQLVFTVQPSNGTSNQPITPAVKVSIEDQIGNVVTTSTSAITISSGNGPCGQVSGTLTVAAVNGIATFPDLTFAKAGSGCAIVASSAALNNVASQGFSISAGPAAQVFLQQIPVAFAGQPFSTEADIEDAAGNIVPTATNSITLAIGANPSGGTLSGTLTMAAINGRAQFTGLSINNPGSAYTLVASSAGLTSGTSPAFNVLAPKLVFLVQPSNAQAGATITPPVRVAIQDGSGTTFTNATFAIALTIGTNPAAGVLSGTTTVNAVSGVATFSNLSINNVGTGYTLVASGSPATSATSNAFNIIGQTMTISTADPLVGVGRSVNGAVVLGAPAASNVTVTLQSSSPGTASISPASVQILQGQTTAGFTVTGVAAGGPVTLTASATGFVPATTQINVTSAVISFGTIPVVGPQQTVSLPVSLSTPAPPGGVTINFTTGDPTIATITTSVFVPAGQQVPAANPQVTGVKIGTTQVNASAIGFAPDARAVTVTVTASFNPTTINVPASNSTSLTLNISAPAPVGGITFNLTTDDSTVATVQPTATVLQGGTSVQVTVTGVGANKSTTLRADSAGITEAIAAVNVLPAPAITLSSPTIGKDLQVSISATLGAPAPLPNGVDVTIGNGGNSAVLLSITGTDAGSPSVTVHVNPNNNSVGAIFVYALADTGTVQLTATATGYGNVNGGVISLRPSGFIINQPGNFSTTTFSTPTIVQITSALLQPSPGLQWAGNQTLRPGVGPITVNLTNDNTNAGTLSASSVTFNGGDSFKNLTYTPKNAAVSNIAVLTPAGFSSSSTFVAFAATVTAPTINASNPTVGKDLVTSMFVSLAATPPVPTDVTISAPNGSNVLLSKTGTDAGNSSVTFTGVTSTSVGTVLVYGLADTGTVQLTASATGFGNLSGGLVTLRPSGFIINQPGNFSTTTFSTPTTVQITSALLQPSPGLQWAGNQTLRPGIANPVTVNLTNDNTNAGTLSASSVTFNGGDSFKNLTYTPKNAGVSNITVVTPAGFSSSSTFVAFAATVTAPTINASNPTVGKDLVTSMFVSLAATPPVPTDVTISAPNGSNVLLSKTGTDAGNSSVTFTGVTSTSVGTVLVYGLADTGTVQLTASATGFGNLSGGSVTLRPSGFIINSPGNFNTTTFSTPTTIQITSAFLQPSPGLQWAGNQTLRPGIANPVTVSLTNDNTNAGTLSVSSVTFNGGDSFKNLSYQPVASGTSHIAVVTPAGFSSASTFAAITATVSAPNVIVPSTVTVGKDLETPTFISLQTAPPNPVDVTISVPVGSPVLLSQNATTAGSSSVTFTGVTSTSVGTLFVQGTAVGTTQLRAQAAGYNDGFTNVTVSPSGFIVNSPGNFTTSVGAANTTVQITPATLNPQSLAWAGNQQIRGGFSISVDVTSTNTTAGTITVSPLTFNGGDSSQNTAFKPGTTHGVTTTLGPTQPSGFTNPTSFGTIIATVN